MTVGNLNTLLASQGDDSNLLATDLDLVYGLNGNDSLINNTNNSNSDVFLIGGEGNDEYILPSNSFTVILDTGNSNGDLIVAENYAIDGENTYSLTIDNRHLYTADLDSDTYALILDWRDGSPIDSYQLSDGSFTFEEVTAFFDAQREADLSLPIEERSFLGDFSWDEVQSNSLLVANGAQLNLSDIGLSSDNVNAAIDTVKATEANFQQTIISIEPGVTNEQLDNNDNSYIFNNEEYYYDFYSLEGANPGEQIEINLTASDFNSVLFVLDSRGNVLESETDGNLTFNATEEPFFISVESSGANQTGNYSLDYSVESTSTTNPPVDSDIIDGNITSSQTINGRLETTDTTYIDEDNGATGYSDEYLLTGATADETVIVRLESDVFDTYLEIFQVADNGTFTLIAEDDDDSTGLGGVASETDSTLSFTVDANFDYVIAVSSFNPGDLGDYTLTTL